jgi:hypothetical protein
MMNRETRLRDNFGESRPAAVRIARPFRARLPVALHGGFLSMDGAQWGLLGTSICCEDVVPFLPNKGE